MHSKLSAGLLALILIAVIGSTLPAQAQLTLTPAGTALGFSLSTFASNFPTDGNIGPYGIAFPSTGGVLVTDAPGNVRLFPTDTDGQNASVVPAVKNYGDLNALDLAQIGDKVYMTQYNSGNVVQINPGGTFNQIIISGLTSATGIVTDPVNGHLFVSTYLSGGIYNVDPIAKTSTPLGTGFNIDGLTISPDGKTLYGADVSSGHMRGYDTSTGTQIFDSGFISGNIDGATLGFGNLSGNLFVNTNGGTLVEVNLATKAQTLIAGGGSRGDFVSVDPNNGTLLLTQSTSIIRLSGSNFAPVPEASSFVSLGLLLLLGLGGLTLNARRRRRSAP